MPDLPEQQARQNIDAMLAAAGWTVQDYRAFDPSVSPAIALREVPLTTGPCDYLLLVTRKALAVIETNCSDLVLIQRLLGFVPQYVSYSMNSLAKHNMATGKVGAAIIHFSTKSVAALAVPLPPLFEQTRIVTEVERRLSMVEELAAVVTTNLQRATRLRQSILQKAFSGQVPQIHGNEPPLLTLPINAKD